MPERLPIKDAMDIAHKRGLRQVILLAWDGTLSHVVTYGKSIEDCDQAAQGGEKLKKVMGWPNWEARPARVKKLTAALEQCRAHLEESCMPNTQPLLDLVNTALRR
jgi:heterodisulfide reductase subunit C